LLLAIVASMIAGAEDGFARAQAFAESARTSNELSS